METDCKLLCAVVTAANGFVRESVGDDVSEERVNVISAAYSLVGKVGYFWGGKSLVLGWDERWGTIQKVTAAGSSTTGTYRPYGMDCSGFVDWVFYNVTGGEYIIGHGGGATMQHNYCTEISWDRPSLGIWSSTQATSMWVSWAAGMGTESCSLSTARSARTMWSLPVCKGLHLLGGPCTTSNKFR